MVESGKCFSTKTMVYTFKKQLLVHNTSSLMLSKGKRLSVRRQQSDQRCVFAVVRFAGEIKQQKVTFLCEGIKKIPAIRS